MIQLSIYHLLVIGEAQTKVASTLNHNKASFKKCHLFMSMEPLIIEMMNKAFDV
ncbi:protein of unknown function [Vibrio tapetis subsp. tapetis]|uniref:Uncharacterized protein n=1 Tax=Vibrio tapetis subsp. tapetis TaxID=1671868 RepID=A0A2N8ZKV9_9VIBR|nr:protein of unknown function [Vibrio tapetis subsp. tapetis]